MCGLLTDFNGAEGNHGTVNFVDDIVLLNEIVGVGDDLVTGDDVLENAG